MNVENLAIALLVVLFLVISLAMVLVVLIQRPQGGGLSGAFGAGGGSGQSAFGARTGDALTISTIVIFLLFLGVAIGLNFALRPTEDIPTVAQPAPSSQTTGEQADDAPLPPPGDAPSENNTPSDPPAGGDTPGEGGADQ